jgi:hypothetical protein
VGEKVLPPIRVEYLDAKGNRSVLESAEIKLEVKSVLKNIDPLRADIRDVKKVVGIEPEYKKYLSYLYVAGGALMGIILFFILRWIFKKKISDVDCLLAPYEEAMKRLEKLESTLGGGLSDAGIKNLYLDLSGSIRRYWERGFGIPAGELTTRELKEAFRRLGFPSELNQEADSFLDACDMVKFAQLTPPDSFIKNDLEQGRRILNSCHTITPEPSQSIR